MKRYLIVVNSNQVNRYGMVFPVGELESLLSQSWGLGMPSYLSHDHHQPIGWIRGLSLHLEPSLARLTGLYYAPESDEECEQISRDVRRFLSKEIADVVYPHLPELQCRLRSYLTGEEMPFVPDCAALLDEGLARRVFPGIFSQQDKDGLVSLTELVPRAPGVFERNGLLLFAHPYFRRSLSRFNALNGPFFEVLQSITSRPDLDIRVALDEDMVGLSSTFRLHIELEYWWGPKFSDDLAAIPAGATRHEASEEQRLFHGVSRTEFWWYLQDGIHTFECEELRDIPSLGVAHDSFGCRFVHSMLDASGAAPVHLDGAIRMYNEEAMIARLETDISRAGRHSQYTKLWRVDGPLEVPVWKELTTHFYRNNHLVGEYLGGEDDSEHIRPHFISSTTYTTPLTEYVPSDIKAGQGIRISVSYHPRTEEPITGRIVRSFDFLTDDSTKYHYIESDTVEVVKALHRMSEQIDLPGDIVRIAFDDMVLNLPLILHLGPDAVLLAKKTQRAIAQLCKAWINRGDDRLISYNIGVQYSDRDVYFSVAGHVSDLAVWHQRKESSIPDDAVQLGEWCETACETLSDTFPKANDVPPLRNMLQESGTLIFERRFLKPDQYHARFDDDRHAIIADLSIPKDDQDVYNIVASGQLGVACAFLVRDTQCSRCGGSYHMCDCSKYLDPGVVQIMSDVSLLGPFWTNRKA